MYGYGNAMPGPTGLSLTPNINEIRVIDLLKFIDTITPITVKYWTDEDYQYRGKAGDLLYSNQRSERDQIILGTPVRSICTGDGDILIII